MKPVLNAQENRVKRTASFVNEARESWMWAFWEWRLGGVFFIKLRENFAENNFQMKFFRNFNQPPSKTSQTRRTRYQLFQSFCRGNQLLSRWFILTKLVFYKSTKHKSLSMIETCLQTVSDNRSQSLFAKGNARKFIITLRLDDET